MERRGETARKKTPSFIKRDCPFVKCSVVRSVISYSSFPFSQGVCGLMGGRVRVLEGECIGLCTSIAFGALGSERRRIVHEHGI